MEHVEGIDAREGWLRALAVDEVLFRGEADLAERCAFQVVDAVRVVGEVVGEEGIRQRDVEVLHGVFEHVDEAVDDGLGVRVGEAEFPWCRGIRVGSTEARARAGAGAGFDAGTVADRWPRCWSCDGSAEEGGTGKC